MLAAAGQELDALEDFKKKSTHGCYQHLWTVVRAPQHQNRASRSTVCACRSQFSQAISSFKSHVPVLAGRGITQCRLQCIIVFVLDVLSEVLMLAP
jgi:hypothetical protein